MGILQDLTEKLAVDTIRAMDEFHDEKLHDRIAKVLLDMSPTTQEAYMTAMRALLAERKGRQYLDQFVRASREGKAAPDTAAPLAAPVAAPGPKTVAPVIPRRGGGH